MASSNILMNEYLKGFKVKGDQDYTHLLWTDNAKGKCYVSPMEMPRFWEVYNFNLENELELGVLEKHRDIAPILIDLDFRQITKTRKYNIEEVNDFVKEYHNCISEYVEVPDKARYFILEKPVPRKVPSKVEWKDGIHILCPDIITKPSIQYKTRAEMLKNWKYFNFCKNGKEDIFDKAVIKSSGWFLYGSKKPDEEHPWKVSSIVVFENGEMNQEDLHYTDKELLDILSIRNKHTENEVLEDKVEEMEAFEASMKPSPVVSNMESVPIKYSGNVAEVPLLCDLLSPERADNYHDWIKVGIALRNTDEGFLPVWIDFSKKSSKFKEGECERLWNTFQSKGNKITIGSIRFWAKHDNPDKYKDLNSTTLRECVRMAKSGTEYDVAQVVYEMYKGKFAYDDEDWYMFEGHKWQKIQKAIALRKLISSEVADEFRKSASYFSAKAVETKDAEEKDRYDNLVKCFQAVITKLKKTAYEKSVVEQSVKFFYIKDFTKMLNENRKLLGFENGVYDLETLTFRDGQPEDYISLSMGYDYTDAIDEEIRADIMGFFSSIQEDTEMRDYLLTTLGVGLDGEKKHQLCFFWTGFGGNGKTITAFLYENTLGELCGTPDISLYTTKKTTASQAHPELLGVKGKRAILSSEPEKSAVIMVGQLKAMTGGDKLAPRQLFKGESTTFVSQAYPFIQMNKKPILSGADGGVRRRLRIINFPFNFVEKPKQSNERLVDLNLQKRFQNTAYYQQFCLILLEKYKEYVKSGYKIHTPKQVIDDTNAYLDENNFVKRYIDDTYELGDKQVDYISASEFKMGYKDWANLNDAPKASNTDFTEALGMYGLKIEKSRRTINGRSLNGSNYIFGLKRVENECMIEDDDYDV